MRSMTLHIGPAQICADLRMQRQKHKGAFALVEGSNDIKRFKKFYKSDGVVFINCWGKGNVIDVIDYEQNAANEDVLGFVDSDFERITADVEQNDDIIYSRYHDFDLDVCFTSVVARYLTEMGNETKLAAAGGANECLNSLLEALKPLSAMRYANAQHNMGYRLSDLNLAAFFDGHTINVEAMIDEASLGKFDTAQDKAALRQRIGQYETANVDLLQFTNGHDLIAAIGIALRDRIGERHPLQSHRGEVERHLRLTFDVADFKQTGHLAAIRNWEQIRALGLLLDHVN